jgi:alanine racemase
MSQSEQSPPPAKLLEVDLGAVASNLAAMRACLPDGARVCGVVKADAYGHGAVPVARLLKERGCEGLAVAELAEGLELRRAGVAGPVLLLLGVWPHQARAAAEAGLTPVVDRAEVLEAVAAAGRALGRPVACQIKVDTGMGRLGAWPVDALELVRLAAGLEGLELTGLVSHLATGGVPADAHAARQAATFAEVLARARELGPALADSSLAGSGGSLAPPPGRPELGWVRLGIGLYGGLPDPAAAGSVRLAPAMRYSARLLAVKPLAAGEPVSYGCTWRAPADTWLGVLPVGYSDGYLRSLSNRGQVLVGGRRRPVRGRVCMNLTVVELGAGADAAVGDEAVLLGRQGEAMIGLDELAELAGTIPYELCCSLGAANRRRHLPAA